MIWNRVDPVFSVRIRLDLLLILVKLQSDIELEALCLSEPCLHHSVPRHVHDVLLDELFLGIVILYILPEFVTDLHVGVSVNQRLASAFVNFLHGKP